MPLVAIAIALSAGISRAQGALEGDVYIQTKGGDIKRAAAITVTLVPLDDAWRSVASALCDAAAARRRYLSGPYADSVAKAIAAAEAKRDRIASISLRGRQGAELLAVEDSLGAGFARIIAARAALAARTNIAGHYRIEAPPGRYLVAAQWTYLEEAIRWRVAATLEGQTTVVDLNHTNNETTAEAVCLASR